MTRLWYVGPNRAPVNWGTAVVSGKATLPITQVTDPGDPGGVIFETSWAQVGQVVPATAVTAAQAGTSTDAVPDRRGLPTGPTSTAQVVLPARLAVVVTKAVAEVDHAAGSWPTARPTVPDGARVFYVGDTDPGSTLAAVGDRWDRVPS